MDLEDQDLAVLEERLYSSIHHSYEEAPKIPDVAPAPTPPLRIVSRTSVINNSQGTLPGNMKRYWIGTAVSSAGERAPYPKNTSTGAVSELAVPEKNAPESNKDAGSNATKKMFLAPYQSLLGNMDTDAVQSQPSAQEATGLKSTISERATVPKNAPKQTGLQLKKKKQTKQTTQYVEKKLESLLKLIHKDRKESARQTIELKKAKASKVRHRKQPRIVDEITLDSSDEDSRPAKMNKSPGVPLSDGEGDEVIIIPTPPPPQICIDCSDEEDTQSTPFAFPKSKPKSKAKGSHGATIVNISRCGSPSNSSIMSDDFIGQHDRSRLNDSYTGSIPSDDELERSMEGMSGKAMKDATEARQERVPSISSEDTVCTSGDTTDQEKHPQKVGKGNATSKSQPQANSLGNTTTNSAKRKKENAATKKTPAKQKSLSKSATSSPNVEKAMSPSASKRNANSKTNSGLALEIAIKQLEAQLAREGSGKKAKAKKDTSSVKVTRSMSKSTTTTTTTGSGTGTSDKSTERIKNGTAGAKSKTKKTPLIDDNVSSESDIDISISKLNNSSTPQRMDKSSRRSASSFIEQIADVSSESDYDESFLMLKKTAAKSTVEKEPKKRIGRKRKQYNSETYSDEDFACLLTDIVRAVSDTEDEDDDTEIAASVNKASNAKTAATNPTSSENCVEELPTSSSKQDRNPKKKKKIKDVSQAADSIVGHPMERQSANEKTDSQQQQPPSELVTKKKKKMKDPKTSVKTIVASTSGGTPEIQTDRSETTRSNADTVQQTQAIKRKESLANAGTIPPQQPLQQIVLDSNDDDDELVYEDIQCHVLPGPSGKSFKKAVPIGPDCAWNEEMKQFYNETWEDEDLSINSVLTRMPYDSRQWTIVHKDRFPDPPKKEITCTNCGDRGHVRFKCRNAPKLSICYMCGEKGHKEPRCPKTICLNCGAKARSFVRVCKSCSRDADIFCFSCGLRGHAQRSCPDLWRRYHSTIEDNVPLREKCEKNPNARWCSICCKTGHQAYMCNDARRIFGHVIPNMKVSSYMPAYRGEYNRSSKHQNDEQERRLATDPTARYNLFSTGSSNCEFNLHELAATENGFYYNFLKATGLMEKYERRDSNDLEKNMAQQSQELIEPVADAQAYESTTTRTTELPVSQMDEIGEPEPPASVPAETKCDTELCKREVSISVNASEVPVLEENSNYSFSEFHTEEKGLDEGQQNVDLNPPSSDHFVAREYNNQDQGTLSDFIPLTMDSVTTVIQPQPSWPEQQIPPAPSGPQASAPTEAIVTEQPISGAPASVVIPQKQEQTVDIAKVLLTNDRVALLLSAKGTEFLHESGKKHNVHLSITFETVGNVLLITGRPEAQEKFHDELVNYLTTTEDSTSNKKYFLVTGPKLSKQMSNYIATFLQTLVFQKESVEEMLTNLTNAKTPKLKEKLRRKLNVQLFGVYGLREGRKHLNTLRSQLAICMKTIPWESELSQQRRIAIDNAIRYIFSAYDHKDYAQLVKEYAELKQANKLRQLTVADLGIFSTKGLKTLEYNQHNQLAVQNKKAKKKVTAAERAAKECTRADKQYARFVRKATANAPIVPKRFNPVGNSTHYMQQQTQGTENMAYSHAPHNYNRSYPNRQWTREEYSPRWNRYHWHAQPEAMDYGQPSTSTVSRLNEIVDTLRSQELSQLQRLEDLLW